MYTSIYSTGEHSHAHVLVNVTCIGLNMQHYTKNAIHYFSVFYTKIGSYCVIQIMRFYQELYAYIFISWTRDTVAKMLIYPQDC